MAFKPGLESGAICRTGFLFALHGKKLLTYSRIHMKQNQNSSERRYILLHYAKSSLLCLILKEEI